MAIEGGEPGEDASPGGRAELMRRLLDGAPDALIVSDPLGRIAYLNEQAELLSGYSRDELYGGSVEQLIPDRARAAHRAHRAGFAAAPNARPMGGGRELMLRRRDGSDVPVEIALSPVAGPRGLLVCASLRDIRDRRRRERELRSAHSNLRAAMESIEQELADRRAAVEAACDRARMKSVARSELMASMSHELRTPLGAVLGFAELMRRDRRERLTATQRARVEQIVAAGDKLLGLVDHVLGVPLADDSTAAGGTWPPPAPPPSPPDGRRRRVVYIVDDAAQVALMSALLDEVGSAELIAAPNLELGLAAAREHGADLLLVDVGAPGLLERDPVRLLRSAGSGPPIPVVAVVAPGVLRGTSRRLLARFDGQLIHPVEVEDLDRTLDDLVDQRR